MKAHVQDGQVVLDEPLPYPEGTRLRVVLDDDSMETKANTLEDLDVEIERGLDEMEAGRYVDGQLLIARLRG